MPAKVNNSIQKWFMENALKPAINAAKSGLCELFFMDAAHFVQDGIPAKVWSAVRMWVKTGSGRKSFNVLGALNFVTKKVETVTNDKYINATSVIQMLEKLAKKYEGRVIKIILDNARYQLCEAVISKAAELNIHLIFLPAYSPDLNYRIWNPPEDGKTKNEHFRDMLSSAKKRGFEPEMVVADSWYSSLKNLKSVRSHGWDWVMGLKSNRLVNKPNVQLSKIDIPDERLKVHLKGYGWIEVFRFAGKNYRTDYIGTSRLDSTKEQIRLCFERRWSIEVMHREQKESSILYTNLRF